MDRVIKKPTLWQDLPYVMDIQQNMNTSGFFFIFILGKMDVHLNRPWFVPDALVPIDPPVAQPPEFDLPMLNEDATEMYVRRYGSIRSFQRESAQGRMSIYNIRLSTQGEMDAFTTHVRAIFNRQAVAFKMNAALGAILQHKNTGVLRYFHPSANNYKILEEPISVQSWYDMEPFLDIASDNGWTEHATNQMPNSAWKVIMITNVTVYVYHLHAHPIGGFGFRMADDDGDYDDDDNDEDSDEDAGSSECGGPKFTPQATGGRKGARIAGVVRVPKQNNNLCVFQCIAIDMEVEELGGQCPKYKKRNAAARDLFIEWWSRVAYGKSPTAFQGVMMNELHMVEDFFKVNINVYAKSEDNPSEPQRAHLVRRSMTKHPRTISVHMETEGHFDYIWSMQKYSSSYVCRNCGQFWKNMHNYKRHEAKCNRASRYKYIGGPYQPRQRFYGTLEEIGIWVEPKDRFYQFRATYDLEACLVPTGSDGIYVSRHLPMSVSIASNVPGMEGPYCIVSDGDSGNMVYTMVEKLCEISDEAYERTKQIMHKYISQIEELQERQEKEMTNMPEFMHKRSRYNLLQTAANKLETWMRAMPVVSFNGAKYDLQLIKQQLASIYTITDPEYAITGGSSNPQVLQEQSLEQLDDCLAYIIKKGNAMSVLATRKLTFLDVCSYIPPGYSYVRYLETYGDPQEGCKSFFPYEYVNSLDKLGEKQLPPYETFYSSLKQSNTLEEGRGEQQGRQNYENLRQLWHSQGMTELKDLLIYYNNNDVIPFVKALGRQVAYYRDLNLDMLKDAPTLPGLALKFGMQGLHGVFHTFHASQSEFVHLVLDSIVGGPSIVFCRYAESGVTKIRTPDYGQEALTCQSVIGLDANALYPWSMAQDLPVGPCIVRREPDYQPIEPVNSRDKRHSAISLQWLYYESQVRGTRIQHAANGPEVKIGTKHVPVDGYHGETGTVFQFHGCLFHGHYCLNTQDDGTAWLGTTPEERRHKTESMESYITDICGYKLVVMWECEWNQMKQSNPNVMAVLDSFQPRDDRNLTPPDPGTDMDSVLRAVQEERLFGMVMVDIHTPHSLKNKFRDMPPIFKNAELTRDDIGEHMRKYCEETGKMKAPSRMLISSYFATHTLVATPLLKWYLDKGLVVTRVYMVMQYDKRRCFDHVVTDAANKRRAADKDPSQQMAGECAKLLSNAVYGKLCERKSRFRDVSFVNGPTASAAVSSPRFRDMTKLDECRTLPHPMAAADHDTEPEAMVTMEDICPVDDGSMSSGDVYELSMAPRKVIMDLPVQIAFFVYAYAKLRMLQLRYDLFEEYLDKSKWCPLYMDTDSYYIALADKSLHDVIHPEKKEAFYMEYHRWFPSLSCEDHRELFIQTATWLSAQAWFPLRECCMNRYRHDEREPSLFKTEFDGSGIVALCSKTYYCLSDHAKDKLSCKGLQKNSNKDILTFDTYRQVLTSRIDSGGVNRGIKATSQGNVFTYNQPRNSLSYLYVKRRVLDDGVHTEPLDIWTCGWCRGYFHIWPQAAVAL